MSEPWTIDPQTGRVRCDPRVPDFYEDPYPFYARLHEQCPVFFWEDFGHWCFAGWDDVNAHFRNRKFGRQILHLTSREALGWPPPLAHTPHFDAAEAHSLLCLEPPEHTRLRTLVNRAFVSRQIERLRPEVATLAGELLDTYKGLGTVDLIDGFASMVPVMIIADMLGVPRSMAHELLGWSHKMVAMYMFGRTEEDEHEANRASGDFIAYLRDLIAETRNHPNEGLISHLIATGQDGKHLTEAEIISTTILLLNAGHEATVHQTGNAVKTILESGRCPAELFATDESTAATVEECLRFDPPLHMFTRYALEDMDLGNGVTLKQGDEIGMLLAAANRDPQRFADPGAFQPGRTDQANVSFGAGIHFCIGAPLARLEMQVALQTLFRRYPDLSLAAMPRYRDVYHFHGLDRLNVRLEAKQKAVG